MLAIEMLPARHGDALLIEYGDSSDPHRILIDGGPYFAYDKPGGLRERLCDISFIDLLVITHVDTDHIDGIIRLLQDPELDIEFGDIWFNGWKHLELAIEGKLGGAQGEYLGALLEEHGLPWNENSAWEETDAVVVPSSGELPVASLPGGATATLVSPGPIQLKALHKAWIKAVKAANFTPGGKRSDVLEKLASIARYGPPKGKLGKGKDTSEANGSSIGFVLEYDDQKLLLLGDAFYDVLETNLATYEAGNGRLGVEVMKLPHHGSFSNVSRALLEMVVAKRYLVSTDGTNFKHPDATAMELILKRGSKPTNLVFNYASEYTQPWLDAAEKEIEAAAKEGREPTMTATSTTRIEIS